jgi:hypothetical protein
MLGVERFLGSHDFQQTQRAFDRRARLDGEPGFERADSGARGGDSASGNFCGCAVRVLEGGTKFARRGFLVRSGSDSAKSA